MPEAIRWMCTCTFLLCVASSAIAQPRTRPRAAVFGTHPARSEGAHPQPARSRLAARATRGSRGSLDGLRRTSSLLQLEHELTQLDVTVERDESGQLKIVSFPRGTPGQRLMRFLAHRYGDTVPPLVVDPGTYLRGLSPSDHSIHLNLEAVREILEGDLVTLKHELRHTRIGPFQVEDAHYPWSGFYDFQHPDPRLAPQYARSFTPSEVERHLGDLVHMRARFARALRRLRERGRRGRHDERIHSALRDLEQAFDHAYEHLRNFCAVVGEDSRSFSAILSRSEDELAGYFAEPSESERPRITLEIAGQSDFVAEQDAWWATLHGFRRPDGSLLPDVSLPLFDLPLEGDVTPIAARDALLRKFRGTARAVDRAREQMESQRAQMERLRASRS